MYRTVERVEQPPMEVVTFYTPSDVYDRMIATAKECGTSASALCRVALKDYLERLETEAR